MGGAHKKNYAVHLIARMKIGIIMHPYGEKKPGGLPRIIFGWAESLMRNDEKNEYVIFLKEKPEHEPNLPGKNWHTEVLGTGRLWLTRLKHATPCDVYLFNTPVLPLFYKPRRSVIIALDYPYKYLASRNFFERVKRLFIGWYHGYSLRRADHIVAVSNSTKNDTVRFFKISPEKISVVYHGYKKICEVPEQKPLLTIPEKYFFFAGTLKERKNVLRIVQAFSLCVRSSANFTHDLVIGGKNEGDYYTALQEFVAKEGITKRVHFLGHLNEPQLSYVYKRAEALVFPSIVEGTGFPILEAMSCGIPVITSNIFGPAELGGNGAAVLVNPYKASEIADAMERLTTSSVFRASIVAKGPAQLEKFSWNQCGQETRKILEKAAQTSTRPRRSITMDFRVHFLTRLLTTGAFLFAPLVFSKIHSRQWTNKKKEQRFFIMPQLTRIGDIVLTTPVFHTIKKAYPDSFIAVLVSRKAAGVLTGNPYINELIILEEYKFHLFRLIRRLQKMSFDIGLSFSGTAFSSALFFWSFIPTRIKLVYYPRLSAEFLTDWLNNIQTRYVHHTSVPAFYLDMLKYAGIHTTYPKTEVYIQPETKEHVRVFLEEQGIDPKDVIIGISITAGNKIKEWGDTRFGAVAEELVRKHNARIIWIGGSKDRNRIEALVGTFQNREVHSIATHFSLEELAPLIESLTLYIAVDTGPIHMAHALGTPLVDITGPVDPWEQSPFDEKSVCVLPPAPFYPSSFVFKMRGKSEEHKKALDAITVSEVVRAAKYLLSKRNIKMS
ncbi:MAG: group 1 glycosyl transferase [Parcubacteria group bacterium Gr01-1014_48]|nr:MAG: group 1 glycosyl transferase [Parcubacteria group bacterium Greene0416_14]TSC74488.1 MAG: group 1 glycosyl transferase [Parcubacteria group bacterium Gr01-1014_48]TSD00346.1 MAG: group 1 glycosyl transferase [Parcubacteria group bacterium Greene1014_15]TSD07757.1 MAG: group 1 glycosyl transferase [Parcubacteria group bacterium Greene0714_4]